MSNTLPVRYKQIRANLDRLIGEIPITAPEQDFMISVWSIRSLVQSLRQFEKTYTHGGDQDPYINAMLKEAIGKVNEFLSAYTIWVNAHPERLEQNVKAANDLLGLQEYLLVDNRGLALTEEISDILMITKLRKD